MQEQSWKEQIPSGALQLTLSPYGYSQPRVQMLEESSASTLCMSVPTSQFKWASQKVRGAEWRLEGGQLSYFAELEMTIKGPECVMWSKWRRVSMSNLHHTHFTYSILRNGSPALNEHLSCHCHQRSGVKDVWIFLDIDFMPVSES